MTRKSDVDVVSDGKKSGTSVWVWVLLGFLLVGIFGNMILMVVRDRRRRKKEKMSQRVSVEYNPDYGIDYGGAEIKDRNNYYANEDSD